MVSEKILQYIMIHKINQRLLIWPLIHKNKFLNSVILKKD